MDGKYADRKCTRCNDVIEGGVINAPGHKEVTVPESKATCITPGFTAYTRCDNCGEIITAGTIIPANGHAWNNGEITKEATETEPGLKVYTCTSCGETKSEVIPVKDTPAPPEPLTVDGIVGIIPEMNIGEETTLTVTFSRELLEGENFEWVVPEEIIITIDETTKNTYKLVAVGAGKAEISFKLNGTLSKNSFTVEVYGKYDAPEEPEADSVTETSITIKSISGCVYSIDGINWQEETVFTDLEPDTLYTVFAKKAADEYMKESAPSKAALIKTKDKWPFSDYANTETLASEVLYSFRRGIVSGFGIPDENGQVKFKADKYVTRAQFAIMVYGMAGNPTLEGIDTSKYNYPDVPKENGAYTAVVWASANGIILGYPNGNFKPDNNISRAQIAVMLKKYADYMEFGDKYTTGGQELATFSDYKDVQEQVKESLQWAIDNGVLSGITATKLKPNGYARRDQCAAFCARFYRKFEE